MHGAGGFFWAGLVPNDKMDEALKKTDWDHSMGCEKPGFVRYGGNETIYDRYSGSDYEPLIYSREFSGIKESYIEISEEFRLLNDLYYDHKENKHYRVSETGEFEPIIKIEEKNVFIKLSYFH